MCGIAGFFLKEDANLEKFSIESRLDLLKKLLIGNISRGKDATGFATYDTQSNKIMIVKHWKKADDFFKEEINTIKKKLKIDDVFSLTIGHVRATTAGTPYKNINNHPHFSIKHKFALVHNGSVQRNQNLFKDDIDCKSECDTEILVRLIEYYLDKGKNFQDASYEAYRATFGGRTVAIVYDSKLILIKNRNPLFLYYHPEIGFVFSSEEKAITDIFGQKLFGLFPQIEGYLISIEDKKYIEIYQEKDKFEVYIDERLYF